MPDLTHGFYKNKNLLNTVYAVDIAIEQHHAGILFDGDVSRIIYATNAYALRKRANGQEWDNASLPFMNHKVVGMSQVDRRWWNNHANLIGFYFPELERNVRITPVKLEYEATVFYHRDDELQYGFQEIWWDDSNETTFTPVIQINGTEVPFTGLLGYNLSYEPQYSEQDWLEQNKIHSMRLDFTVDTFFFKSDGDIWVSDTVALEWAKNKDLDLSQIDEYFEFTASDFE